MPAPSPSMFAYVDGKDAAAVRRAFLQVAASLRKLETALGGTVDLVIRSDAKGLVLKSPNGHYWRETIDNTGTVTWTDVGTTPP